MRPNEGEAWAPSFFLFSLLLVLGCVAQGPQANEQQSSYAHQLVPAQCAWIMQQEGYLPDPNCSPGDVLSIDTSEICVSGYSATVRDVPQKTKNEIYASYGVVSHTTGEYEIDHIVPLAIGGSNDKKNLFPQPAEPRPGFHEKDRLENWLHDQVCQHGMNITRAQELIARNWTEAYVQMNFNKN